MIGPPGAPSIGYAWPGDEYAVLGWSATSDGGQPIAYYTVTMYSCTPITNIFTCQPLPLFSSYTGDLEVEQGSGWYRGRRSS